MSKDYILPVIGQRGRFNFKSPFNTEEYSNEIFKVISIRSLLDLKQSNEKPFESIYQPMGLTESEYSTDTLDNVPIVVLEGQGGYFLYVPANRIDSAPIVDGRLFQSKVLSIYMGDVPTDYDFQDVKEEIEDLVYELTGIKSTVEVVNITGSKMVDHLEATKYERLIKSRKEFNSSYYIKYIKLLKQNEELKKQLEELAALVVK